MNTPSINSRIKSFSPFFKITPFYRWTIIILLILNLLIELVSGVWTTYVPQLELLAFARIIETFVLLLPIFLYHKKIGWMHPFMFQIYPFIPWALLSILRFILSPEETLTSPIVPERNLALPGADLEKLVGLKALESLLSSFGLISYYFAFLVCPRLPFPKIIFSKPERSIRKLAWIAIIAILVFFIFLQTKGGLVSYLISWEVGRATAMSGTGVWLTAASIGSLACIAWFSIDKKCYKNPLFIVLSLSTLAINFLSKGSRATLIGPIFVCLLVWMLRHKKIPVKAISFILIFSILVYGLLGNFRRSVQAAGEVDISSLLDISSAIETVAGSSDKKGEFEFREQELDGTIAVLGNVPSNYKFLYGSSYVTTISFIVPRAIWPNKPRGIGYLVGTQLFGLESAGVPPGMIGEGFWNFGAVGVGLIFSLYGIFHKQLTFLFIMYHDKMLFAAFYIYVLIFLSFTSTQISQFLVIFTPLIIVLWYLKIINFKNLKPRLH